MNLIQKASLFAEVAHSAVGQLRPTLTNPNVPYIVHPREVACIVLDADNVTDEMIAAALLHDVLEDTQVSYALIDRHFGEIVASYVHELTDRYTHEGFPDLNRETRKELEARRFVSVSPGAKTIKLADGLSNTPSIAENRASFLPIYGKEKRRLLESLRGGDERLWKRLDEMLKGYGF